MPCTTILVGKKASFDGSTMIARNDDGFFDEKKLIVVQPKDQARKYKSKIGHLEIQLPDNPLRYTSTPSVNPEHGVWAANGINAANVAMTATETITTNPRVLAADPMVRYQPKVGRRGKEVPGGLGEEDLVYVVLPYIHTAREGVERLGALLEQYGTYESNGIAFSDGEEIWWMETIGGHHWIAVRVPDDRYVIMPNQFGIDHFDFDDALGKKKNFMCSADMKEFVEKNHLALDLDGNFNPRLAFGSHSDSDHVYNTPRAWYMARYFNPRSYKWDGPDADFTPESDDIPWSLVPEHKITVEEVKYILSSYYQGTAYNPYGHGAEKGKYRPIGIGRTGTMAILQIRGYLPREIAAVEWICFGPNSFNAALPVYANVNKLPAYLTATTMDVDTDTFYWASRLIAAMADNNYTACIQLVERYQGAIANGASRLVYEYDEKMVAAKKFDLLDEANKKLCELAKKEATDALGKVLRQASLAMKCNYNRADN